MVQSAGPDTVLWWRDRVPLDSTRLVHDRFERLGDDLIECKLCIQLLVDLAHEGAAQDGEKARRRRASQGEGVRPRSQSGRREGSLLARAHVVASHDVETQHHLPTMQRARDAERGVECAMGGGVHTCSTPAADEKTRSWHSSRMTLVV